MNKVLLSIKIAAVLLIFTSTTLAGNGLIGWATYNALGQNGTTGGGDGSVVRVTTRADLEKYAQATEPYTILVEGSFIGTGMISVVSNKSIIGVGSGTVFDGFGIKVNGQKNVIIRNLTIKHANPDAISIGNTHHVWIDHCDLSASSDGLLDFTIGSNYLTVSWTKFHEHNKVALANSGTQHAEDVGKNKVTYHHNWFYNTVQRNPRVGYGMGHIFNNYYTDVSLYCVGYHTGASVFVENNYFYKSKNPLNQMYTSVSSEANYADAKEVGNIFDLTTGNITGTGVSFDPENYYQYRFALDSAKDVPFLVRSSAGPTAETEYDLFQTPANGSIDVDATDTFIWTNLENVTLWEVYFGTSVTSFTKESTEERLFIPGKLEPNTEYCWKVNAVKPNTTIEGAVWKFTTLPEKASKPFPADGELHARLRQTIIGTDCSPLELTWTPGFDISTYKVYLGVSPQLTNSDYKGEVSSPSFAPGPLKYGVKYYWRIASIASDSSVYEGEVWNFTSDVSYSQEGNTEAEDMMLNGCAFLENQDGKLFTASNKMVVAGEAGEGTMSSLWAGPNAICDISVSYFDESDGRGWYGFFVNENKIDEWFASEKNEAVVKHTISKVLLHKGDELRIAFYPNRGELNRTDFMNVKVVELFKNKR